MKKGYKIGFIMGALSAPIVVLVSCNLNEDKFERYTDINDVLNLKNGWKKTLCSQFGNASQPDQFPPHWSFRQIDAERVCGSYDTDNVNHFTWKNEYNGTHYADNSKDGYLQINYKQDIEWTDSKGWKTNNFSSSISTENSFEQAFGYWECEAKFLNKQYGWAAFWAQSHNQGHVGYGGRDGCELDFFESFNWNDFRNEVRLNAFADGYYEHSKEFGTSGYYVDQHGVPIDTYDYFHKFGFLWTPTTYYMYVDHNLVFKTTAPIANHHSPPGSDNSMGICQVPVFPIFSGHMGPNKSGEKNNKAPNGLPFSEYNGEGEFLVKNFTCYQNEHFEPYIKQPSDFN